MLVSSKKSRPTLDVMVFVMGPMRCAHLLVDVAPLQPKYEVMCQFLTTVATLRRATILKLFDEQEVGM
jgi:hypothetical protein